jgi:hypothetical protein
MRDKATPAREGTGRKAKRASLEPAASATSIDSEHQLVCPTTIGLVLEHLASWVMGQILNNKFC